MVFVQIGPELSEIDLTEYLLTFGQALKQFQILADVLQIRHGPQRDKFQVI